MKRIFTLASTLFLILLGTASTSSLIEVSLLDAAFVREDARVKNGAGRSP